MLPDPIPFKDAFRRTGSDLVVPDGELMICGPFDEHANAYRIAEVSSFEDLQQLWMIPPSLTENDALDALRADMEIHQVQRERIEHGYSTCSCQDSEPVAASIDRPHRRAFRNIESALGINSLPGPTTDDPYVWSVVTAVLRWSIRKSPLYVGMFSPENISIGVNSQLVFSPSVSSVTAGTVDMKSGSRWRFESGSVSVSCDVLNGPPAPPLIHLELPPRYVWVSHSFELDVDLADIAREKRIGRYLQGYARERSWSYEGASQ